MKTITILMVILKYVSIVASGLFGAIGVLGDYRDSDNKITKWGKLTLFGILVSSFIAIITFSLEYIVSEIETQQILGGITKQLKQSSDQLSQNEKILSQINRSVHSLGNIKLNITYSIPIRENIFPVYTERIEKDIFTISKAYSDKTKTVKEMHDIYGLTIIGHSDDDREGVFLQFPRESKLFPHPLKESIGHTIMNKAYITVSFLKRNKNEENKDISQLSYPEKCDLILDYKNFDFHTDGLPGGPRTCCINRTEVNEEKVFIKPMSLLMMYEGLETIPRHIESNGEILSAIDLVGAKVFIRFKYILGPGQEFKRISDKNRTIHSLSFTLDDKLNILISQNDIKVSEDNYGRFFYSFEFENDWTNFKKRFSSII